MPKYPDAVNKYNHTPRKVFDKYTEKIERKMQRLVADQVAVEKAVLQIQDRLIKLEQEADELAEVVDELDLKILHLPKRENPE